MELAEDEGEEEERIEIGWGRGVEKEGLGIGDE